MITNKQLIGDEFENQISFFKSQQSNMQTAIPGIILSYNYLEQTCSVQPAIQYRRFNNDGTSSDINLPVLIDCPVQFPSGAGTTITFPVSKGDECLVVFSSRCIDGWWYNGAQDSSGNAQPKPQLEMRMHDLSDGFVLLGFRSIPRILNYMSTTSLQIRTDDGNALIDLNPSTHAISINTSTTVNVNSTGNTSITAPTVAITGNLTVSGTIVANGEITGNGTHLHTHTHSGVQPGSGNSGGPN